MKVINKVLIASSIAILTTGCSTSGISSILHDSNAGYFKMEGDVQGIRAGMDGFQGMAMAGKAVDNIPTDTPHYEMRRNQNQVNILREQRMIKAMERRAK